MPAGLAKLVGQKGVNWDYDTAPEPQLDGRALWWPRGKVLGGSSSINAMCYIRGVAADYDDWAAQRRRRLGLGRRAALLPAQRRQRARRRRTARRRRPAAASPTCATQPAVRASSSRPAQQAGYAAQRRLQRRRSRTASGLYQVTQRDGARCSARGRLPATRRARARTCTVAPTPWSAASPFERRPRQRRGLFDRAARPSTEAAAREVLLCGGAINSPQLLMLSGIGPADATAPARHRGACTTRPASAPTCRTTSTSAPCSTAPSAITYDRVSDAQDRASTTTCAATSGPGTSNIAEAGGFVRSPPGRRTRAPTSSSTSCPAMLDDHGRHRLPGDGYTLHACFLRPRSRGRIAPGQQPRRRQAAHRRQLPRRRRKASTCG